MNNVQKAKLKSNQLVVIEARSNLELMNSIPAFAVTIDKIADLNTQIENHGVVQETDQTGVRDDKNTVMNDLGTRTAELAGSIHSYGTDKGDETLKAKVNLSYSEIARLTPNELLIYVKLVLELAKSLSQDDLTHYGISAAEITEYESLLNLFTLVKSSTREISIERTIHTSSLASLFSQSSNLLTNIIDKLLLQFKRKSPDYFARIKSARNQSVGVSHKKKSGNSVSTSSTTNNPTTK